MNKLTHFRLCPLSRSIRLLLGERDIPYEIHEQRAWEGRPEFLSLNPAGELPVLMTATGEVVCGAYAISEYVADRQAAEVGECSGIEPFPGDAAERAEARRLAEWFNRKFYWEVSQELLIDKVYPLVSQTVQPPDPEAGRMRAVRANLRYHLSYVSYLADNRPWLAGDRSSYADLAAAAHLSTVDYLGEIEWDAYPQAKDWYMRMKSRPTFRPLLAERIVGPEPPEHYSELDF
ncbi:MAG: hypothetical protein RLZ98_3834 [Pseudomonadota bacterium]|jgi:glutathione S-transferase